MPDAPRTALLIDAGYLDKICLEPYGVMHGGKKIPLRLDLKRLPEALLGQRPWRVFYYGCLPYQGDPPLPAEHAAVEAKKRFFEVIARFKGWVLRQGVLELRGNPRRGDVWYEQKRVDVWLAVDLTRLAWRGEISEAVLLTGDSDFVPAVADAREAGVRVRLFYGPGTAHPDLIAAVDEAQLLDRQTLEAIRLESPR